jgi:hypothetical protein
VYNILFIVFQVRSCNLLSFGNPGDLNEFLMMEDRLKELDRKMDVQNCKILQFLDNTPVHPE